MKKGVKALSEGELVGVHHSGRFAGSNECQRGASGWVRLRTFRESPWFRRCRLNTPLGCVYVLLGDHYFRPDSMAWAQPGSIG